MYQIGGLSFASGFCVCYAALTQCSFGSLFIPETINVIDRSVEFSWTTSNDACRASNANLVPDPALSHVTPARNRTVYVQTELWKCANAFLRSLIKSVRVRLVVWTSSCIRELCSSIITEYHFSHSDTIGPLTNRSVPSEHYVALCQKGKWALYVTSYFLASKKKHTSSFPAISTKDDSSTRIKNTI